ncbi:PREDICTED: NKG2-A/NKG2-B type II integral membrane protein-like, partial [Condylura cristata]|uniref:NKG2-A/NKG2-B type II integral membrane protein-like n=1 Tax=Condylura cristata TaxID=143302 RepID=UPI00064343AF
MIAAEDLGILLVPTVVKIIVLIACSPAPPEKRIAGVLGCTCLVLICVIVAVKVKIVDTKNSEQDGLSTATESQKEYSCGPCPQGWLTYSNSCYYFSPEPKTWNESVSDCQRNNSQLLLIDNDEEM